MSTPLVDLKQRILQALPDVSFAHAQMVTPERVDAFDVHYDNRMVAILWTAADGFSIVKVCDGSVWDCPDFAVTSADEALQFVTSLLKED